MLVTGATGFVGQALVARLLGEPNYQITAAVRSPTKLLPQAVRQIEIKEINLQTDWSDAVRGVEVVVHLAARVHVMREKEIDPWKEFKAVNVQGSINLARQAAAAGVTRMIYISSIKVNGEITPAGKVFSADDVPMPTDLYARSKYEAEKGVLQLGKEMGMDIVIIRPPLVYGPGVKANFRSMMKWIYWGVPLPLGAIDNRRTLVAVDNLVDLIVTCGDHPAAANQVFLAGDGEDMSTTNLLRRVGTALGCSVWLLPIPTKLLQAVAALIGRRSVVQRLCGSLQIDISKNRHLLDWRPPFPVDRVLQKTADHFLSKKSQ